MLELCTVRFASPIGEIVVVADTRQVYVLEFAAAEERVARTLAARFGEVELRPDADPLYIAPRLAAYFDGDRTALDGVAVDGGGTPFQRRVWAALRTIPAGTAISYAELAEDIGQPAAVRAVGHANSQNPLAIVVPCHRVVGADGSLTGYAGGIERKRWLLEHEDVDLAQVRRKHLARRAARTAAQGTALELFTSER